MPRQGRGTQCSNRAAGAAAAASGFQQVHRYAFVQELMRKGCMLESAALDTFEQLTGHRNVEDFHDMIAEQNREMDSLGLGVRTMLYPVDQQRYIGLVNKMSDDPAKLATHYNHGQREFFKHVLETIASDEEAQGGVGSAAGMHLLNLDLSRRIAAPAAGEEADGATQAAVAAAKKLTKTEKEQTLKQLVTDGWLRHSTTHSGHYCIGVRSFLELGEMLLNFDIPDDTKTAWENIM